MSDVRVAGVGMNRFGRMVDRSERSMVENVVQIALEDAGITASDVQRVFSGNAAAGLVSGQEMIRGQVWLQGTGLAGVPLINTEKSLSSCLCKLICEWSIAGLLVRGGVVG